MRCRYAALDRHGPEVAEEAEAGDVDAGVHSDCGHGLGGRVVQSGHHGDSGVKHVWGSDALLCGGRDEAGADGLGEHQRITGPRARVGDLFAGTDKAGDGHAVLGLFVVDCVAADYERACLAGLGGAALEDAAEDVTRKADREADYVQRQYWAGAHSVDVTERVGGGYLAEGERVVDDGREEVHGLYQGEVVVQAVDGGVIGGAVPDEQVRIGD